MLRVLLTPRWLALSLLSVAAVAGLLWTGAWQWQTAANGDGGLRNYSYAVEWWLFAGFACYVWWRMLRDAARAAAGKGPARSTRVEAAPEPEDTFTPPPRRPAPVDEEPDEELAAYNAYLARLAGRSRQ